MKKIVILIIAITFYGCGTNTRVIEKYSPSEGDVYSYQIHQKTAVPVPNKAIDVFMKSFAKHLDDNAMTSNETEKVKKKIDVTIKHYKVRHGASRHFAGAFAGCDKIQTTVEIMDQNAKKVLGSSQFESSNCTAWGTTKGLIDGHVKSIVKFANPDAIFAK